MTGLKTLLGPDRAARLITETTAFLAAHPRLKQSFEAPGLGAQAGGRVMTHGAELSLYV